MGKRAKWLKGKKAKEQVYPSNHYFIIGARSKNSGSDIDDVEYFKGFIDQIAVFSVALSEQEIKKIAAEGAAVSPLQGRIPFERLQEKLNELKLTNYAL